MDQLYCWDQAKNEPYWVIYARTSKDMPYYPAMAKQDEQEFTQEDELAPAYIPVRIR